MKRRSYIWEGLKRGKGRGQRYNYTIIPKINYLKIFIFAQVCPSSLKVSDLQTGEAASPLGDISLFHQMKLCVDEARNDIFSKSDCCDNNNNKNLEK